MTSKTSKRKDRSSPQSRGGAQGAPASRKRLYVVLLVAVVVVAAVAAKLYVSLEKAPAVAERPFRGAADAQLTVKEFVNFL